MLRYRRQCGDMKTYQVVEAAGETALATDREIDGIKPTRGA